MAKQNQTRVSASDVGSYNRSNPAKARRSFPESLLASFGEKSKKKRAEARQELGEDIKEAEEKVETELKEVGKFIQKESVEIPEKVEAWKEKRRTDRLERLQEELADLQVEKERAELEEAVEEARYNKELAETEGRLVKAEARNKLEKLREKAREEERKY